MVIVRRRRAVQSCKGTPFAEPAANELSGAIARAFEASFAELVAEEREASRSRLLRYELKLTEEANARVKKVLESIDAGLDARMDEAFERRVAREIDRRLSIAKELK